MDNYTQHSESVSAASHASLANTKKLISKSKKPQIKEEKMGLDSLLSKDIGDSSNSRGCMCNPVLVVDDNDFNLFTFKEVLKSYSVPADGAANGQKALEMT